MYSAQITSMRTSQTSPWAQAPAPAVRHFTSSLRLESEFERKLGNVFPSVYRELKTLALRRMGCFPGRRIDTTGLVREAYFTMVDHDRVTSRDKSHFYATAALAMRQILVAAACSQPSELRELRMRSLLFDGSGELSTAKRLDDLLVVHREIENLQRVDPRLVWLLECRVFAGLTEAETARALELPIDVVQNDWRRAKVWLQRVFETSHQTR